LIISNWNYFDDWFDWSKLTHLTILTINHVKSREVFSILLQKLNQNGLVELGLNLNEIDDISWIYIGEIKSLTCLKIENSYLTEDLDESFISSIYNLPNLYRLEFHNLVFPNVSDLLAGSRKVFSNIAEVFIKFRYPHYYPIEEIMAEELAKMTHLKQFTIYRPLNEKFPQFSITFNISNFDILHDTVKIDEQQYVSDEQQYVRIIGIRRDKGLSYQNIEQMFMMSYWQDPNLISPDSFVPDQIA